MGFQFGTSDQKVKVRSTEGYEWGSAIGTAGGAFGGPPGMAVGGVAGGLLGSLWDLIADEYFPEYETVPGQQAPIFAQSGMGMPMGYDPMGQTGGYLPAPAPVAPMTPFPQSQPVAGGGFLPLPGQSPYMYG